MFREIEQAHRDPKAQRQCTLLFVCMMNHGHWTWGFASKQPRCLSLLSTPTMFKRLVFVVHVSGTSLVPPRFQSVIEYCAGAKVHAGRNVMGSRKSKCNCKERGQESCAFPAKFEQIGLRQ
jgi:hypothetical protein